MFSSAFGKREKPLWPTATGTHAGEVGPRRGRPQCADSHDAAVAPARRRYGECSYYTISAKFVLPAHMFLTFRRLWEHGLDLIVFSSILLGGWLCGRSVFSTNKGFSFSFMLVVAGHSFPGRLPAGRQIKIQAGPATESGSVCRR